MEWLTKSAKQQRAFNVSVRDSIYARRWQRLKFRLAPPALLLAQFVDHRSEREDPSEYSDGYANFLPDAPGIDAHFAGRSFCLT